MDEMMDDHREPGEVIAHPAEESAAQSTGIKLELPPPQPLSAQQPTPSTPALTPLPTPTPTGMDESQAEKKNILGRRFGFGISRRGSHLVRNADGTTDVHDDPQQVAAMRQGSDTMPDQVPMDVDMQGFAPDAPMQDEAPQPAEPAKLPDQSTMQATQPPQPQAQQEQAAVPVAASTPSAPAPPLAPAPVPVPGGGDLLPLPSLSLPPSLPAAAQQPPLEASADAPQPSTGAVGEVGQLDGGDGGRTTDQKVEDISERIEGLETEISELEKTLKQMQLAREQVCSCVGGRGQG